MEITYRLWLLKFQIAFHLMALLLLPQRETNISSAEPFSFWGKAFCNVFYKMIVKLIICNSHCNNFFIKVHAIFILENKIVSTVVMEIFYPSILKFTMTTHLHFEHGWSFYDTPFTKVNERRRRCVYVTGILRHITFQLLHT